MQRKQNLLLRRLAVPIADFLIEFKVEFCLLVLGDSGSIVDFMSFIYVDDLLLQN